MITDYSLTASMLTLSGSVYGDMPRWDLPARSDAAARAGFAGIGAWSGELDDSSDLGRIKAQTAGAPITELEWHDLGDLSDQGNESKIFRMADTFGARVVNTGVTSHVSTPAPVLAAHLRRFATGAADHGLTVAVEPISFGAYDMCLMAYLVRSASDLPNVGFLWDMFQTAYALRHGGAREGWTYATVARDLPTVNIQLTGDGSDAMQRHMWRGACPQVPMVTGMQSPVSVEITNRAMRTMAPTEAARRAMQAARRIIGMQTCQ